MKTKILVDFQICISVPLKYQKIDNRSWDIYVFSHKETYFYTFAE